MNLTQQQARSLQDVERLMARREWKAAQAAQAAWMRQREARVTVELEKLHRQMQDLDRQLEAIHFPRQY